MPSKTFLRILIVGEIVLSMLGFIAAILTESTLPEPLRDYLEAEAEAGLTPQNILMLAAGIPLLIALLASSIGLFVFWRPSRILYLITTGLSLVTGSVHDN